MTDANLVLGRLNPQRFLGGELALDEAGAKDAIEKIAGPLGYRGEGGLVQMAEGALAMLRDVLVAFSNEDIKLCLEIRKADNYIDRLNREVVAWAREWIEQDVEKSGAAIELLAVAQQRAWRVSPFLP